MYNDILGEKEEVIDFKIETMKLKAKTRKLKVRWSLEIKNDQEIEIEKLDSFLKEEFMRFIEKDKSPIYNAIYLLKKAIEYSDYVCGDEIL